MTKKHRIRIGIIIVVICMMGFSDLSFAEDTTNNDIVFLGWSLNVIVGWLSWLWVIFAKLAGELLTNKWVYGEAIGLDTLLRKYWNIVKNFANFGLGFYFVFVIFRGLISTGKESVEKILKNTLLWLLIAGIGIQSSWFLTAAVIDMSTIAMSAAGAFPSMVMSKSPYTEESLKDSIRRTFVFTGDVVTQARSIDVGENSKVGKYVDHELVKLQKPESLTGLIDALQPRPEDVAGPLYFIGLSILDIKDITSINSTNSAGRKATIFNTIIQGGATIIYGIEMAILCIVAIMRLLYLRLFIMVSPIAILLRCIQKSGEKIGGNGKGFLSESITQLNLGTFLTNVFKPAIVVLGLGIAAIFAGLMSNVVKTFSEKEIYGVKFSSIENPSESTQDEGDITYTSDMDHNLFKITLLNTGKTFLELVLSIITVIMVYKIISIAMKMGNGKDFVGSRIDKIQDAVGSVLGKFPVVPVPGYDKDGVPTTNYIGASTIFSTGGNSLLGRKFQDYDNVISERNSEDAKIIQRRFGNDTEYLTSDEMNKIRNAVKTSGTGNDVLKEVKAAIPKSDKGKGMNLLGNSESSKFWREQFTALLNKKNLNFTSEYLDFEKFIYNEWKTLPQDRKTLEELFKKDNARMAYMKYFAGKDEILTREKMAAYDISKNNDSDNESDGESGNNSQGSQPQNNPPADGGGSQGAGNGSTPGQGAAPGQGATPPQTN